MGLVVQAPTDALLALLAGPTGEAASAAPAEGDLFASLMASMLPGGNPEGAEGEGDIESLTPSLPPTPDQEAKTSNEAALALLTATAIVQFVPQSITPTESAAVAPAKLEPADGPEQVGPLPSANADTGDITGAGASAEPAPTVTESTPAEPLPAETPVETATLTEGATAALEAESPALPVVPRTEAQSEPSSSDAPAELPTESGVVRSVGNAENANRSQSGEDNAKFGERGQGRGPARTENTPRASAKGIEHAAANSPVGELRQLSDATPIADVGPVEAPAPAEVPQQVDQVAASVFESVEVGATEARLRLDPAEMGEVVIHIQSDGEGGIRVEVRAERPEAAQLLRDHTQDLSQLLGDRGLNLTDVNVGLGRGDSEQSSFGERRTESPANGEFASILGIDEPGSSARHNRLRLAYNPDGAHIYRV